MTEETVPAAEPAEQAPIEEAPQATIEEVAEGAESTPKDNEVDERAATVFVAEPETELSHETGAPVAEEPTAAKATDPNAGSTTKAEDELATSRASESEAKADEAPPEPAP